MGLEERVHQLEQRLRQVRIGRMLLLRLLQEAVEEREALRAELQRLRLRRIGH